MLESKESGREQRETLVETQPTVWWIEEPAPAEYWFGWGLGAYEGGLGT